MASRFLQYGVALLLVHALAGCSSENPPPSAEKQASEGRAPSAVEDDRPIVVAFGDSLFAGYQLGQSQGFSSVLEGALAKLDQDVRLVNGAVSGDTSAAGLQRLGFMLDGLPRKPALVIVELGGNDMLRGLSPDQTRANLEAILAELRRREIPAMLVGMVAASNLGPDYAKAFNSIYPDLAAKYDVPLYPFVLEGVVTQPSLMLGDGIHPNPKGVEAMVSRIAPVVDKALERQ